MSTLHGPSELVAEELAILRDAVLPAFENRSGFRGLLGFVEPERGQSIVVSLWNREEDMRATDEEARFSGMRPRRPGGTRL